ncbi:MAG: hypothetical protein ACI9XU_001930 [Arenicella sp.]|jgi:hypothetical protein
METWRTVIGFLAYASVGVGLISAYLQLNKIWKRKHKEDVANSISLAGHVMTIVPGTIFALNYLLASQWQGFLNSLIWICWGSTMMLIGSGMWVQGRRKESIWVNIKRALRIERSEIGTLAMVLFRPASADLVLKILTQFAWIDNELDQREKDYIQSFADSWNLKIDWSKIQQPSAEGALHENMVATHNMVKTYLETSPPRDQVRELADVLKSLVEIDDEVTEEESVILTEVLAILAGYGGDEASEESFSVVIVPRNREQGLILKTLLPGSNEVEIAGGFGHLVGSYRSPAYANRMCERYREQGFFTVSLATELDIAA